MDTPLADFKPAGTLGALLIGVLISCFLFGIATLQAYTYYIRFTSDRSTLKLFVLLVYLCELGHCVCVCHSAYYLTIVGYDKPVFLVKTPASLALSIGISGAIGSLVQMFFAERLRILSQSLAIPIFYWILSLIRFALSVVASVEGIRSPTYSQFLHKLQWLLTSVLCIGVAVDLLVSVSLCKWFHKTKSSALKRTAQEIEKIMGWTIQTGLLTSITGVVMLICFKTMPENFVWLAIFSSMARLYSNSLFATLNARSTFRRHEADLADVDITAYMRDLDAVSGSIRSQIVFQRTKTTANPVEARNGVSRDAHDSSVGDTEEQ